MEEATLMKIEKSINLITIVLRIVLRTVLTKKGADNAARFNGWRSSRRFWASSRQVSSVSSYKNKNNHSSSKLEL